MQRVTISLDDSMAEAIDAHMARNGYNNRSEAIRDMVRDSMVRAEDKTNMSEDCIAAVSYVYDYDGRDLAVRLDRSQHAHHDLTISSMRARLDHHHCLEVTLLKGKTDAVRKLRGVRFGQLNLVPIRSDGHQHSHGEDGTSHHHATPVL
jgi:CopG family transcriptional regulator, nickel-responsive regulator